MKQEITRQDAKEIIDLILKEADEILDRDNVTDKDHRKYYQFGWLKSAFENAIVKGQLSKEDLGIK